MATLHIYDAKWTFTTIKDSHNGNNANSALRANGYMAILHINDVMAI